MVSNRIIYSLGLLLFLIFAYVIFPVPVYWTEYAHFFRIFFLFYSSASSFLFFRLIGDSLEQERFSPIKIILRLKDTLRRKEILMLLFIVLILKIYAIYANPLFMISDESFHLHRGQAFLLYFGSESGILGDTFDITVEQFQTSFNRYPPLGMVFQAISFLFIGSINSLPYVFSGDFNVFNHFILDEMAVRLPSLVFVLLTVIISFKLFNIYYDERVSLLATSMIMFFPTYFIYTSSAFLVSGVVFFVVLSTYFLMKYVQTEKIPYLILCALVVSVGALYKRPIIFFSAIILLYLLFSDIKHKKKTISLYSIILILITAPYYMMIQFLANLRPFGFVVPSITKLLSLMFIFSIQATPLIFLIFVLSVFFVARKTPLSRFSVIWFILWYLFFSFDWFVGDRLIIPLLVPIALFSSDFIMNPPGKLWILVKKPYVKNILALTIVALFVTESIIVFNGVDDIRGRYIVDFYGIPLGMGTGYNLKNNKFPFFETAKYLTDNLDYESSVATLEFNGEAFFDIAPILEFYLRNSDGFQARKVFEINANETSDDEIYDKLTELNVRYFVIPQVNAQRFGTLLSDTYTPEQLKQLESITTVVEESDLFVYEEEFAWQENVLIVFALRDT